MNTLLEFALAMFLAVVVVLIHYETLRLTSLSLSQMHRPPRRRILVVIGAAFLAHLVEVTLYAASYLALAELLGSGQISGEISGQDLVSFYDYFYYSMTCYTTLGIGDFYPMEGLRLLTAMESLVGLMMITWSASFTYLAMEKFWKLH